MITAMQHRILTMSLLVTLIKGCRKEIDIVFVLDGSSKISLSDFMFQKSFVAAQPIWYTIRPNMVNLGAILSSPNETNVIKLDPYMTGQDFSDFITRIQQPHSDSSIYMALRKLREYFYKTGRKSAEKYGILITEGKSKRLWNTFKESRLLRMSGVNMIVIGVGDSISLSELNGVTSNRDRVLRVRKFNEIFSLSRLLHTVICPKNHGNLDSKPKTEKSNSLVSFPNTNGIAVGGGHDVSEMKSLLENLDEPSINKDFALKKIDLQSRNGIDSSQKVVIQDLRKKEIVQERKTIADQNQDHTNYTTAETIRNYTFPVVVEKSTSPSITGNDFSVKVTDPPYQIPQGHMIYDHSFLLDSISLPLFSGNSKISERINKVNLPPVLSAVNDSLPSTMNSKNLDIKPNAEYKLIPEKHLSLASNNTTNTKKLKTLDTPFMSELIDSSPNMFSIQDLNEKRMRGSKIPVPVKLFPLNSLPVVKKTVDKVGSLKEIASILGEIKKAKAKKRINFMMTIPSFNFANDNKFVFNDSVVPIINRSSPKKIHVKNHMETDTDVLQKKNRMLNVTKSSKWNGRMKIPKSVRKTKYSTELISKQKNKHQKSKPSVLEKESVKVVNSMGSRRIYPSISEKKQSFRNIDKLFNRRRTRPKDIPGMRPFQTPYISLLHKLAFMRRQNPHNTESRDMFQLETIPVSPERIYRRPVQSLPTKQFRRKFITKIPFTLKQNIQDKNKEMCKNKPYPKDRSYYLEEVGDKYEIRPCPDGTSYDFVSCGCSILTLVSNKVACRPELVLDFNNSFIDTSGKRAAVGPTSVNINHGTAVFSENSEITIWRFVGASVGDKLMIKIKFKPGNSKTQKQLLVGNCADGIPMSYGMEINRKRKTVQFVVDTLPRKVKQIEVPMKMNDWNQATLIYDGLTLTGIVNGQKKSVSLSGDVEIRSNPLFIGRCDKNTTGYAGDIAEVSLYFCLPQRRRAGRF